MSRRRSIGSALPLLLASALASACSTTVDDVPPALDGGAKDSAALAEWLQDQPWTPECVIASGASYAAGTAWAFATETNSADRSFRVDGVVSKVPTIAAMSYKYNQGLPFMYPNNQLSYVANFLHMMFTTPMRDYEPSETIRKALDALPG